jgi:hypothetical protein
MQAIYITDAQAALSDNRNPSTETDPIRECCTRLAAKDGRRAA